VIFTKVLIINISQLNPPPSSLSFIPPSPILEIFQQFSFLYLHTCVHNISTIFTLLHLFLVSSPSHQAPRQDLFCLCALCFCNNNNNNNNSFICLR
jgi:hypothetical protein